MKPRNAGLDKTNQRVLSELMEASGWPRTPRPPTGSGFWWILDRLGDQLEENR